MLDFYFEIPSIVSKSPSLDWTAIAATTAAFALVTTWWLFFHDKKKQQSLFYLNQIKAYFTQATSLLSANDNSNVNWHQAIEILKMADELVIQLKDKSHQSICVMDMMNTGFQIINIITRLKYYMRHAFFPVVQINGIVKQLSATHIYSLLQKNY